MDKKLLDLRGLSCPIPLMKTRDALAGAAVVTVVVDEAAPRENIIKFAKSQITVWIIVRPAANTPSLSGSSP